MGQILHGSATTTEAVRRAIQHSQASLRALAQRYGINQKTVAKWKKRSSVNDQKTGPKEPRSTVLSVEDEARLQGGEITTEQIGLAVLARLRELDEVAYVRFASVYKGFDDPGDFEREIGLLKATAPKAH